eukprot:XP_011682920.1 PREDICTED: uncharacterized protein LOC583934 isoform X2 [Strongylocentrotus purpuratus]
MDLKRMYVTYNGDQNSDRKKLVKLDTTDFDSMTFKIKQTFALPMDEKYAFHGRVEASGPLVELDEHDSEILDELIEVSFNRCGGSSRGVPIVPESDSDIEMCSNIFLQGCSSDVSSGVSFSSPVQLKFVADTDSDLSGDSPLLIPPSPPPCSMLLSDCSSDASPQMSSSHHKTSFMIVPESNSAMPGTSLSSSSVLLPSCSSDVPLQMSSSHHRTSSMVNPSSLPSDKKLDFDMKKILEGHNRGASILEEYNRLRLISPTTRKQVISIMAAELVAVCGYYPTMQQKHAVAKAIISFFPELKDPTGETGYEHIYCSKGGQSGYLFDKLKNIRRNLPDSARMKSGKGKGKGKVSTSKGTTKRLEAVLTSEEMKEAEALCRNSTDKNTVRAAMAKCSTSRHAWIQDQKPFMKDILQRYPRYRDMPDLVQQDFQEIYPDASDSLLKKWDGHAMALLAYASTCREGKEINDEYHALPKTRQEHTQLFGFLVLMKFLPSYNTKGKGRVSQADMEHCIVHFHDVHRPVTECLKDTATRRPSLLVKGTKNNVEEIFLQIEEYACPLHTPNIVNAFDILFKSYYVYNLAYPVPASIFYLYLQTQIFGLHHDGKLPPAIREIASAVNAAKK